MKKFRLYYHRRDGRRVQTDYKLRQGLQDLKVLRALGLRLISVGREGSVMTVHLAAAHAL